MLRNINNKVLKAWYSLLNGTITVSSYTYPIYRTDAPADEEGNYILLRVESDSQEQNNQANITRPVIICEVVTRFKVIIDDGLINDIDDQIVQLLFPGDACKHNLPAQSGISISDVQRQSSTIISEDDGTFKYQRLITRNVHSVSQT